MINIQEERIGPDRQDYWNEFVDGVKQDKKRFNRLHKTVDEAGHKIRKLTRADKKLLQEILSGDKTLVEKEKRQLKEIFSKLADVRVNVMYAEQVIEDLQKHLAKEYKIFGTMYMYGVSPPRI